MQDPQRWNRYAYSRDNPLRYVDPDGREIALSAEASTNRGQRNFLTKALREIARRPSGREALTELINEPNTVVFAVGGVNDDAKIQGARKGEDTHLAFGTTSFLDPTTNEVTVTIDRNAIGEFASRTRPPIHSGGVSTMAHEIFHAQGALSGSIPEFLSGDKPTSSTGPAEAFGQAVWKERKDLSKKAAQQLVAGALEKKK